jgi:uncharacterized protein (UPF0212 family)
MVRLTISPRRRNTMKKFVIVATAALVVMSISMTAFAATKTQIKTQIRVPGTVCGIATIKTNHTFRDLDIGVMVDG